MRRHGSSVIGAFLVIAGSLALAAPCAAGPAMSRGQQFFSISHQECLARASTALRSAGYSLWGEAGNGPWGERGPHSAVILCEPAAGNREVVDIVVSSEGTRDGNVPGAERIRLQQLMEGGAPAPAGGPPPSTAGCVGFRGRWMTRFGPVVVRVDGNRINGDYVNYDGQVSGTISGNVLDGEYAVPDGRKGSFRWVLSADGQTVTGQYQEYANPGNNGEWNATCVGPG
jgi:hypothetical protein